MIQVQIDSCVLDREYQPAGKTYTIWEWVCSGHIDGVHTQGFTLKALSGKEAKYVQAGWCGWCEADNFNGATKYKIPTPPQGESPQGQKAGLQPVQQSAQPQGGMPPPPPQQHTPQYTPPPPMHAPQAQAKLTFESLEALIRKAHKFAFDLCDDAELMKTVIGTYVIQASNSGLIADVTPVNAPQQSTPPQQNTHPPQQGTPPPQQDPAMLPIANALNSAGLAHAMQSMDHNTLKYWWNECNASPTMFAIKVNEAMKGNG